MASPFVESGLPEFLMSVPILSPDGQVIGALAGINRSRCRVNFLDNYVGQRYGASGGLC
ncbi:MAG: hypothetical protein IPN53_21385 [Comamonadaceae bacterium]|nr:hypothetical protein [Comamonadaceae bacterium]